MKLVRSLHPHRRPQHRLGACLRVISHLHRQIQLVEAEILLVRHRLGQCRACDADVASDSHLPPVCVNYPEKIYRWEYDFPTPGLPDVDDEICIKSEAPDASGDAPVDSFDPDTLTDSENNVLKADGESTITETHDPRNVTSLLPLTNTNG